VIAALHISRGTVKAKLSPDKLITARKKVEKSPPERTPAQSTTLSTQLNFLHFHKPTVSKDSQAIREVRFTTPKTTLQCSLSSSDEEGEIRLEQANATRS